MSDDGSDDIRQVVREGYEQGNYAEVYRDRGELTTMERRLLEPFAERLPRSGSVVDLGCGVGEPFDRWLIDEGFEVTGVDIASTHVQEARRRVPEAEFVEADLSEWRRETSFDGGADTHSK